MDPTTMIPGLSGVLGFAGGLQASGTARNIRHFVNDLGTRQLADNQNTTRVTSKNSSKIARRARKKAAEVARNLRNESRNTATEARDANAGIYDNALSSGTDRLVGDRRSNIGDIRSDRRAGMNNIGRTAGQNLNALRGDLESGLGDIGRTRQQNIASARGARDKSLQYFEPAIGAGNNALGAVTDTLGLSQGGYNLSATPQTQYLLNEGRTTVEGGAAGAGGLYSGETLAELEKMRTGLVSQDRDNQLSQLFSLVGIGQNAGVNAAGVRGDARDAIAGARNTATGQNLILRDSNTGQQNDVRNDATQARLGLRDATTGQIMGARNTATAGVNALQGYYSPLQAGVNDQYANRMDTANTNFANGMGNAFDAEAARGLDLERWKGNTMIQNRNNRMNSYLGIAGTTLPVQAQAIQNGADYLAAGAVGTGNAINANTNNAAQNTGMQNPNTPYGAQPQQPWASSLYQRPGQYQY